MSQCRDCHQNVTWATTISGRKVPLDPTPGWKGRYVIIEGQTGEKFAKVVSGKATEPTRHTLHLATCPARAAARR